MLDFVLLAVRVCSGFNVLFGHHQGQLLGCFNRVRAVLLEFAESGRLEAHRARVLKAGAERLTATLEEQRAHAPISFPLPFSGFTPLREAKSGFCVI